MATIISALIGMFFGIYPAYRAACAAIAGDVDRARREYDLFLREYRDKIAFGREP